MATSAAILAGGRGSRLGGAKPLAPFCGRPLLAWALDAVSDADELLVATGPGPAAPTLAALLRSRGAVAVADGGEGPGPALRAAAEAASGERLLVAPCDAPLLTPAVYRALAAAAAGADGAAPAHGGRVEPLVGVYRRDALLAALRGAPEGSGVAAALRAMRVARVDAALLPGGAQALADADDAAGLARLEALMRARDAPRTP